MGQSQGLGDGGDGDGDLHRSRARPFLSVVLVAAAFTLVNWPSVSTWAGFGVVLKRFLADPARLKWFNIAMGVLLALTLVPMLL